MARQLEPQQRPPWTPPQSWPGNALWTSPPERATPHWWPPSGAAKSSVWTSNRRLRLAGQRAGDAGWDVQWLRGDLEALPVPDDSADVVLSGFGVMYASDQPAAARELARIAAPHVRVVLTSWMPGSVLPAMGQVLSGSLPPPPPSSGPPSRWGDPVALRTLLEDSGLRLTATSVERLALDFPGAAGAADFLIRTAGQVVSEQQRLTDDGRWDGLRHDLVRFVQHRADPNVNTLSLTLEYLLVTASKQPPAGMGAVS